MSEKYLIMRSVDKDLPDSILLMLLLIKMFTIVLLPLNVLLDFIAMKDSYLR